jgi:hypothetical protein
MDERTGYLHLLRFPIHMQAHMLRHWRRKILCYLVRPLRLMEMKLLVLEISDSRD